MSPSGLQDVPLQSNFSWSLSRQEAWNCCVRGKAQGHQLSAYGTCSATHTLLLIWQYSPNVFYPSHTTHNNLI